jgi:hypothetical protein
LIVIVLVVVWFAVRAAQSLVTKMQTEVKNSDFKALGATSKELQKRSSGAVSGTHDITWRAAELTPVIGGNLTAVRVVAESIDAIVDRVAVPAASVVGNLDIGARTPSGGFDLTPLVKGNAIVADAISVFGSSIDNLKALDTSNTVGPVTNAVSEISKTLVTTNDAVVEAKPLLQVAQAALGTEGPRNYLLAFQNNAESTALGGSAASYILMSVDNGKIGVADAANSGDFEEGIPVDVPVDQSAIDLYGSYLIDHVNTSTSRPDFPTAASVISAFWLRDRGSRVDGVISVDPIALALILKATGPITLASGDVLTDENAVSLLTNGVYKRFPNNEDQPKADAFFAEASAMILDKVTSGSFDPAKMIKALSTGVDQGDVMFWSSNPEEQALLTGDRVQGVLPPTNSDSTVIGAYYRDTSASKIDYYLNTSTKTTSDVCTNSENPTFSTTVTLHSDLTAKEARDLPEYVMSRDWKGTKFRTEIFVYGPVGATVANATVDAQGLQTYLAQTTDDLGRPVASFAAFLAPGETTTVTATFTGAAGTYGPLEVRGTPMINKTKITVDNPGCK